ncbi:hypothetical protein [Mucilaginibacter sp. FT3.2]|uniref:hypothetical protein n=1 Tax=Mucilaginibacter sp. FT3.2 TaxID=2723090 RepID=UPI0016175BE7|nr:hypothetical protein [Mucilaginibacter sp. FT3.2]MBB6234873.1 hypothetical protein [Mucilaginibacter sp. FT3.2]
MTPKTNLPFLPLFAVILCVTQACKENPKIVKHRGERDLISFKTVQGIGYSEISRRTATGLSFNEYGYHLEPQWQINFVSNDSASIYSPTKGQFINFPLTRGYDSIFNTARVWFKVKIMNKDSLKLELIDSYGDTVDTRGAKIYMLFYADNYIKNTLHTNTTVLKRASARDSLFIRALSDASNKDYTQAFAATQPVTLTSNNPKVRVKKWTVEGDILNHFDTSDEYMNPTFDIVINKAHADFYYSFSIIIDSKGAIHYGKPLIPFLGEGLRKNYIQQSEAVMESYLKKYLAVKPGSTLGIIHASEINLHVGGKVDR